MTAPNPADVAKLLQETKSSDSSVKSNAVHELIVVIGALPLAAAYVAQADTIARLTAERDGLRERVHEYDSAIETVVALTDALRTARRDALEEAAKEADILIDRPCECISLWPDDPDPEWYINCHCKDKQCIQGSQTWCDHKNISKRIRALATRDTTEN